MADGQPCNLRRAEGDCNLRGQPGVVTLTVEGTTGSVVFQSAKYHGTKISSLPAKTMTLTLAAGKTDLVVTYSFSDPTNGAGDLKEGCVNGKPLLRVTVREPSV